jgi:hypothetical protein
MARETTATLTYARCLQTVTMILIPVKQITPLELGPSGRPGVAFRVRARHRSQASGVHLLPRG